MSGPGVFFHSGKSFFPRFAADHLNVLVNYGLKLLVALQIGFHHGDLLGGNVLGAVARTIPPLKVAGRAVGGLT